MLLINFLSYKTPSMFLKDISRKIVLRSYKKRNSHTYMLKFTETKKLKPQITFPNH